MLKVVDNHISQLKMIHDNGLLVLFATICGCDLQFVLLKNMEHTYRDNLLFAGYLGAAPLHFPRTLHITSQPFPLSKKHQIRSAEEDKHCITKTSLYKPPHNPADFCHSP